MNVCWTSIGTKVVSTNLPIMGIIYLHVQQLRGKSPNFHLMVRIISHQSRVRGEVFTKEIEDKISNSHETAKERERVSE